MRAAAARFVAFATFSAAMLSGCRLAEALDEKQKDVEEAAIYSKLGCVSDAERFARMTGHPLEPGPQDKDDLKRFEFIYFHPPRSARGQVLEATASTRGQPLTVWEIRERFWKTLKWGTVDDWVERTSVDTPLKTSADLSPDCIVVPTQVIERMFAEPGDGWAAFARAYPGSEGITAFSRVGFSRDGTQALVYRSNSCSMVCGGGEVILLQKSGGSWSVLDTLEVWAS